MSTRGAIVRGENANSWKGVYHHWDSYPEGLGAELYRLCRERFDGDSRKMLKVLIDEHPAGWSSINDANWDLSPGYVDFNDEICVICGKASWEHYYQNWESRGKPLTDEAKTSMKKGQYMALGHSPERDWNIKQRPKCFCHGSRNEEAWEITNENASGSGVEYAYVFPDNGRVMLVISSFNDDDSKMVGAFGMGNKKATWRVIGKVDLSSDIEPDWAKIE